MLRNVRGFQGAGGLLRGILALAGSVLVFPTACGNSEDSPPNPNPIDPGKGGTGGSVSTGGTSGKGGTGGKGGGGGEGGEPTTDPLAPSVRITSPENLGHPDDGTVLVGASVDVVCEVTRSEAEGSDPVDSGTVRIKTFDEDGKEIPGTIEEGEPGVYTARFFLQEQLNGPIDFECTASDSASTPHTGRDAISNFVDHGPAIDVVSPAEDSAYALGPVSFVFNVLPDPLVEDDSGAEVDEVKLIVLGREIELDEQAPGEFHASINFDDKELYPEPPETVAVTIVATNQREPEYGTREYPYFFEIDSHGPTITVTDPEEGDVVGGEFILHFTVEDDISEVDPNSVYLTINDGDAFEFIPGNRWSREGNDFTFRFDTSAITSSVAQVTFNINAKDIAGNDAVAESLLLYLDDQPPIVDLDPPMVREFIDTSATRNCSNAFDPLGSLAASDLDRVGKQPVFRALVWERTNSAPFLNFAGLDQNSVNIYIQTDPQQGIFIDRSGDGVCDDITDGLQTNHLAGITPFGGSRFGDAVNEPPGAPPYPSGPPNNCEYKKDTQVPTALCTPPSSDMTRLLPWDFDSRVPAIFGTGPFVGAQCTGTYWEIGANQNIEEGWVCVAGRAVDAVGNVGISLPLRLCYDDGVGAAADCSGTPPDCLADCTMPPNAGFPPNSLLRAQ